MRIAIEERVLYQRPKLGVDFAFGKGANQQGVLMARDVPQRAWFFAELRRRRVLRVIGFHAITVWLILQVSSIIFPALYLPDWLMTVVVVAIAASFPVVAVLAWVFDITPAGLVRTSATTPDLFEDDSGTPEHPRLWIDIAIIGILLTLVAYLWIEPRLSEANSPRTSSIAVLPLLNLSTNPGDEFLGRALAEDMIHHLTQITSLRVAARTSTWAIHEQTHDIREIADTLGVETVLEGSVQRDAGLLRVTLQLIRGSDGYHLWSRAFTRPFDRVASLKQEITLATVESLGLTIDEAEQAVLDRPLTKNIEAYELYLRALEYHQRPHSGEARPIAISLARQAVDRDPRFGAAYGLLCNVLLDKYADHRASSDFEEAERACHRALTLDHASNVVRTALAQLYRRSGQYEQAEEYALAALDQRDDSEGRLTLASILAETDRDEAAEALYRELLVDDPGYWLVHYQYGLFLYQRHRYDEAAERLRRVIRLTPDASHGYSLLAGALFMGGRVEEAAMFSDRAVAIEPTRSTLVRAGLNHWYNHDFERAADAFERAIATAPDDFRNWCRLGMALRHNREKNQDAQAAYRRGIELGLQELVLNPSDAESHARMAHCFAGMGDANRARESIATALALAPDSATEHFFAAATFAVIGDIPLAIHHFERSATLGYSKVVLARDPDLASLQVREDD